MKTGLGKISVSWGILCVFVLIGIVIFAAWNVSKVLGLIFSVAFAALFISRLVIWIFSKRRKVSGIRNVAVYKKNRPGVKKATLKLPFILKRMMDGQRYPKYYADLYRDGTTIHEDPRKCILLLLLRESGRLIAAIPFYERWKVVVFDPDYAEDIKRIFHDPAFDGMADITIFVEVNRKRYGGPSI